MQMYALRDREQPEVKAFTSYFLQREEAEAAMAQMTRHTRDRVYQGHEYLEIVEVERESQPCAVCGGEAELKAESYATYPYCRSCHYTGAVGEHQRMNQITDMSLALGEEVNISVWHTGGGCFLLSFSYPDGWLYLATDGDAGVPSDDEGKPILGGWFYLAAIREEAYEEGEEGELLLEGTYGEDGFAIAGDDGFSDLQLITAILRHRRSLD